MNGISCRICGNPLGRIWVVREAMFRIEESFDYFECHGCGCLQIVAIPESMERYYPSEYYSFSSTSRDRTPSRLIRALRAVRTRAAIDGTSMASRIVRSLFPNPKLSTLAPLGIGPDSRILDVGCGMGWRLYALREAGFRNVLGIDPFAEKDIVHDNGIRIEKRYINETKGQWDVVMFHHSFEHVPDPLAVLQHAARLLAPAGRCLIRIPTVSSFAWEHYREHWYQIDAPRHFHLHSVKSLSILAERAGFRLMQVIYDSTRDQFWKSEMNRHAGDSTLRKIDTRRKRFWAREAKRLNREGKGDQAAFYLLKI
jgi:SAM-dependent methyltransferase